MTSAKAVGSFPLLRAQLARKQVELCKLDRAIETQYTLSKSSRYHEQSTRMFMLAKLKLLQETRAIEKKLKNNTKTKFFVHLGSPLSVSMEPLSPVSLDSNVRMELRM